MTVPCCAERSAIWGYGGLGRSPPSPVLFNTAGAERTGAGAGKVLSGGAEATAFGTTRFPMVGTEKLMAGESGVTTMTWGAADLSCSVGSSFACSWEDGGGGGVGSRTAGTGSSTGAGGLTASDAFFAPVNPMIKNITQMELVQASLLVGSRRAAGRQKFTSSECNGEQDDEFVSIRRQPLNRQGKYGAGHIGRQRCPNRSRPATDRLHRKR